MKKKLELACDGIFKLGVWTIHCQKYWRALGEIVDIPFGVQIEDPVGVERGREEPNDIT